MGCSESKEKKDPPQMRSAWGDTTENNRTEATEEKKHGEPRIGPGKQNCEMGSFESKEKKMDPPQIHSLTLWGDTTEYNWTENTEEVKHGEPRIGPGERNERPDPKAE